MATAEQQADHKRDNLKHEWRPGDRMPLDQRLALARLIGYAEGITSSGILGELGEFRLRAIIAETIVAFDMKSSLEGVA
jgi:hypothetical protein